MLAPSPLVLSLTLFALAVWGLALWRGGPAERWGAVIVAGNQALTIILTYFVGHHSQGPIGLVVQLTLDGATAVALLLVLLRFGRPWLGVAMLLYAGQFALHSVYLVAQLKKDYLHVLLNNLNFLAIHLCLAVGVAQHWLRRARSARSVRPAPQPPAA